MRLPSNTGQDKCNVLPKGIDNIVGPYVPKSTFTIESFGQKLYDSGKLGIVDFPVKAVWMLKAQMKVCFFVWAATKRKISTKDVLKRRNFLMGLVGVLCT